MNTTNDTAGSLPRMVRWFSVRKPFTRCWVFGIGVGWDKTDWTLTVLMEIGPWLVLVGPHLPLPKPSNSSELPNSSPNDQGEPQPPTAGVADRKSA